MPCSNVAASVSDDIQVVSNSMNEVSQQWQLRCGVAVMMCAKIVQQYWLLKHRGSTAIEAATYVDELCTHCQLGILMMIFVFYCGQMRA